MKLNLGCGGVYKKGFLNVDSHDTIIADKVMDANNLQLEDNTVEYIEMMQVIEHLGISRGVYAFSECFRILKPKGKLIIETPDLRSSFRIYLDGDREDRKNILPWIFGVDIPGMQHRFCFPDDLLEELLQQIGFVNIKTQNLMFDEHQPILRLECEKPQEYKAFQLITHFRKNIVKNNLVDLDQQIEIMEKDNLIIFFTTMLDKYYKYGKEEIFIDMIIEGTVCSPILTYYLLQEIPEEKTKKHFSTKLKKILDIAFPNMLLQLLIETEGYIGEQDKLFSEIYQLGRETIEKIIESDGENSEELIQTIKKDNIFSFNKGLDYFSNKLIMLKSNKLFQIGVKEFNLEHYEKAIKLFDESVNLFRDQLLAYWNLGRLSYLKNRLAEGKNFFNNALKILHELDVKNKTKIINMIEKEKYNHKQVIKEPVISLERL